MILPQLFWAQRAELKKLTKDSGFQQLSVLFKRQVEIQTNLLALEESKKRILIAGDIDELEKIIKQQSPFILSCANIEKQRIDLVAGMGFAEIPFNQLVEQFPHEEKLEKAYEDLVGVLVRLKKVNNINKEILHTRISSIKKYMSILGAQEYNLTYDKDGHF
jgi:flagellar biosynthesis/type III secretory pathway chaperone